MKYLDVPQSGSQANTVASRNRFGQYKRTRAIPVNPSSSFQVTVRARMQGNADAWKLLTGAQRDGWASLGAQMTRQDSLGQTYTLTGFMAFCSLNNNQLAAGNAVLTDAPLFVIPYPLTTMTPTITAATLSIAYTVTPLAAGARVFVFLSPMRSAGVTFNGDYRLVLVSAAAAVSPANPFSAYSARFGVPITGARIFVSCQVYTGGFLSTPLMTSVIVA